MNRDDEHLGSTPPPSDASPTQSGAHTTEAPVAPPVRTKRRRGPRPVPPGVPYHRVLARDKRGIWRGIAALTLLMGGLLVFAFGFVFLGVAIDMALGRDSILTGGTDFTPATHATSMLGLAALLPWSMLIQRWLYGVKGASLHSILSRFRPAVFGRSLLVILPIWTIYLTTFSVFTPYPTTSWTTTDLVLMLGLVVLVTPLQSAGEEYGFRGLAFRVAASWGRGPRTALVIGVVVSSLLFMVAHFAFDPWLNLYYFTFGATLALITWRTGGLELAVVIHAVNNTIAFLFSLVTHTDFTEGMDRSTGAGSPIMLVPCVLLAVITAVVWMRSRRTEPPLTPTVPEPGPVTTVEHQS